VGEGRGSERVRKGWGLTENSARPKIIGCIRSARSANTASARSVSRGPWVVRVSMAACEGHEGLDGLMGKAAVGER
jgi:hypothetical protein